MFTDVTRVTRFRAVDAESCVKEQLLTKRDLFPRHGIVRRDRHLFVARESGGKRLDLRSRRSRRTGDRDRVSTATDECNGNEGYQKQSDCSVAHECYLHWFPQNV